MCAKNQNPISLGGKGLDFKPCLLCKLFNAQGPQMFNHKTKVQHSEFDLKTA